MNDLRTLLSSYIESVLQKDESSMRHLHLRMLHHLRMDKAKNGRLKGEFSSTELNMKFDELQKLNETL